MKMSISLKIEKVLEAWWRGMGAAATEADKLEGNLQHGAPLSLCGMSSCNSSRETTQTCFSVEAASLFDEEFLNGGWGREVIIYPHFVRNKE